MQTLRVVTLAGDSEREADVAALFAGEPNVELFMRCVDRVELLATMRGRSLTRSWQSVPPVGLMLSPRRRPLGREFVLWEWRITRSRRSC